MTRSIYLIAFLSLLALHCSPSYHITQVEKSSVSIDDLEPDEEVVRMIKPFKQQLDAEMNDVIGSAKSTLRKGRPESTLGNWFCDALHTVAVDSFGGDIAFAIQNYGGIRINELASGPITVGNIYELMPFDNMLMIVELEYDELMQLFRHMAGSGGWPVSRQLKMVIRDGALHEVMIAGKAIDKNKSYRIAMPDYIANGGDNLFFLADNPREDKNVLLRDAIIAYVKQQTLNGISMDGQRDKRIEVINP